jgi:hypothetical protein
MTTGIYLNWYKCNHCNAGCPCIVAIAGRAEATRNKPTSKQVSSLISCLHKISPKKEVMWEWITPKEIPQLVYGNYTLMNPTVAEAANPQVSTEPKKPANRFADLDIIDND